MSADDLDKFLPGGANADIVRPTEEVLADAERLAGDSLLQSELEAFKKQGTVPPMLPDQGQRAYVAREVVATRNTAPERLLAKVIAPGPPNAKKTKIGLGPGDGAHVSTTSDGAATEEAAKNVADVARSEPSGPLVDDGISEALVKLPLPLSNTTQRAAPRIEIDDDRTIRSRRERPARVRVAVGIAFASFILASGVIALLVYFARGSGGEASSENSAKGGPVIEQSAPREAPSSRITEPISPPSAITSAPAPSLPTSEPTHSVPQPLPSARPSPSTHPVATVSASAPTAPTPAPSASDRITPRFH